MARLPLRWVLYATLAIINVWWLTNAFAWWYYGLKDTDWNNIANLSANPYENHAFRWTPLAGWIWAGLVEPLGVEVWRLAHLAVLVLLPWRVALLALLSGPFWIALEGANMIVFAVVAAWHAIQGNRIGIIAFVVLAALVPRPLMLPILAVLLWRYPLARWSFGAALAVVLVTALASELFDDFLARMLLASGDMRSTSNMAPSWLIGAAWIPIGIVLSAFLMWKRRYGLASIAMSPYWFHAYLLFALIDLLRIPALARPSVQFLGHGSRRRCH